MKRIQLTVLILFACLILLAQKRDFVSGKPDVSFIGFTTDNGLSNNKTEYIFQDSKGFVWIGTSGGLNRFDGFHFMTFFSNRDDSTSISDNRVNLITEDTCGTMWIMTDFSVNSYNRKTGFFQKKTFRVNQVLYNDLPFISGLIDSRGYLWAGASRNAIFRFKVYDNPQVNNRIIDAERFTLEENDVMDKHHIRSMAEDKNGTIWAVTFSKNLFYFDDNTSSFKSFSVNLPDTVNFSGMTKRILVDHDGDIFVSVEQNGLLHWDRKNDRFKLIRPVCPGSLSDYDILDFMAEDQDGLIWVGEMEDGGILIFDKKNENFRFLQSNESDPFSLNSNKINCIHRDRTGAMWIGTIKGINLYVPEKIKFRSYYHDPEDPHSLNFNNILCFEESRSGYIWVGTDGGGLNRLDRKTGTFKHYKKNPSDPFSLASNAIISICEDKEGVLWLGTFNGGLVKREGNKFYSYKPDPSDPYSVISQHIWNVLEDSRGNLWAASLNKGLDLFDRKTGRFYHYRKDTSDETSLLNNSIIHMFEDSRQNLYITSYSGVSIIDLKQYDFSKYPPDIKFKNLQHFDTVNSLSSSVIFCACEDRDKNIWFGTMATGIDKYDPLTGIFTNFSVKDGLPGNSVSSILAGNDNILWLGTDKGLASFNTEDGKIEVFGYDDGLQNVNISGGALMTADGELFFGGPNGFNSFYPDKIRFNTNIPPVVITGLRIYNKPVNVNEKINNRTVLKSNISETGHLILSYKENFFTLEFIALDYAAPEKNQYAYKMEGFDENWIECGTKKEASFTNLNPGKYQFTVIACNNDGTWNRKGTSLQITILPPWWKTAVFKIIFVLLVIFLIFAFFSYRTASYRRKQAYLRKLVAKRTTELEIKNSELREQTEFLNEKNALLEERQRFIEEQSEELRIQAEELNKRNQNLKILNATKDKFFSIIAHDLKNPFNSILGFSELLFTNFSTLNEEKKLRFSEIIYISVKKVYKLLENLLQWARSQTGTIEYCPEELFLDEILYENILLVKNSFNEKEIEVETNIHPNARTFGDRNMIHAVFRNILSNALKFTEKGKIRIELVPENGHWKCSIEDSGTGIPQEKIDRLFEIDQAKSTTGTRGETGTGLGLILCREFIEKNQGNITVESKLGKGSVFTIHLQAL